MGGGDCKIVDMDTEVNFAPVGVEAIEEAGVMCGSVVLMSKEKCCKLVVEHFRCLIETIQCSFEFPDWWVAIFVWRQQSLRELNVDWFVDVGCDEGSEDVEAVEVQAFLCR